MSVVPACTSVVYTMPAPTGHSGGLPVTGPPGGRRRSTGASPRGRPTSAAPRARGRRVGAHEAAGQAGGGHGGAGGSPSRRARARGGRACPGHGGRARPRAGGPSRFCGHPCPAGLRTPPVGQFRVPLRLRPSSHSPNRRLVPADLGLASS
jgi:hypothetical protein